jgi:hypothetical protein
MTFHRLNSKAVSMTCFALALLFGATAFAQQNYVSPTIKSTDGSSLCLGVTGALGNGTPVVVNDCITGHPSQAWTVGSDRRLHFGAANDPYCVGPSSTALQATVQLWPCASAPMPNPNPLAFTGTSGPGAPFCVGFGNNAPGTRVVMYLCSINSPTFAWTNTIAARWASLNMNPSAFFDPNGYAIDFQARPMIGLGARLVALRPGEAYGATGSTVSLPGLTLTILNSPGNYGGKIVASGAGNIVASGAGNIVASGAGNLQIVKSNGVPLADQLIDASGNIVASGAGNIVASGAGNIVASGAGNIVNTNGSNLVGSSGGTYTLLANAIKLNYGRGDSSTLNNTIAALKSITSVPAPVAAYTITSVAGDAAVWAVGSHRVSWTATGSPASTQTVNVNFQTSAGTYAMCANAAANQGYCVTSTASAPAGSIGVLSARDSVSGRILNAASQTQMAAVAPQAFKLASVTANSSAWVCCSTAYRLSWQSTGTAAQNQQVSIWLQVPKTTVFPTGLVRLATTYATQGYYDYSVSTVSLKNVTGSLLIKDESTQLQVGGPTIQIR